MKNILVTVIPTYAGIHAENNSSTTIIPCHPEPKGGILLLKEDREIHLEERKTHPSFRKFCKNYPE